MSLLLEPYTLRQLTLANRIVVSPMCQYSAVDGLANDWHLVHLGSRAVGGAGLVFTEACAVSPQGRITPQDLGLWNDAQIEPLQRITRFIVAQGSIPGIQIAHAGRKGSTWRPWVEQQGSISKEEGGWQPVGASPIAFAADHVAPTELTVAQIDDVVAAFVATAKRALVTGFKVAEVHAAHGYLIHQFLSPLSNQRTDEYGGSLENRMRLALRVSQAIREVWPQDLPVFVRLSATDWVEGGWTADDSVVLARALKGIGIDLIDVSSGGSSPTAKIPVGPGYQTAFAERIKKAVDIPTATVGMITEATQAEHVLRTGQADLVLLARELLRDPYWALNADEKFGERRLNWPAQYARAAHRDTPIHESDLRD